MSRDRKPVLLVENLWGKTFVLPKVFLLSKILLGIVEKLKEILHSFPQAIR